MITLDQAGRTTAWTRVIEAPTALSRYVEYGWITSFPERHPSGTPWLIVPDTAPHVIATRIGDATRVCLVGARSRAARFPLERRTWTVGVRLRPGTLPRFAVVDAADLTDRSVRLQESAVPDGSEVAERIAHAKTPSAVARDLFHFLERRLAGAAPGDWRVRWLHRPDVGARQGRVGTLAQEGGVSTRTLRDVMNRDVGLAPKQALRVLRLQRAAELALRSPRLRWSRVAVAAGYYDQSHLIRDFGDLLGETPEAYRARRNGA